MVWAPMQAADFSAVYELSKIIHPGFPESSAVMEEKFRLYPEGCFFCRVGGVPSGYAQTHPWDGVHLPALNTPLGGVPTHTPHYYLHDIALLPGVRRGGHGREIVGLIRRHALAHGFTSLTLVAVNGSVPFWQRQGFAVCSPGRYAEKLASYGEDARLMVWRVQPALGQAGG